MAASILLPPQHLSEPTLLHTVCTLRNTLAQTAWADASANC
jgi:hypothetical protein